MKELSIEEKAARFDEAIEGIQEILSSGQDSIKMSRLQLRLQGIFPELKESEDERVRKEIIDYIKTGTYKKDWIAWLEKQGEHKKFRDSIQVGDKVTRNEDGVLINLSQLNRVAKKDEKQGKNNMGISEATKKKLEDNLNRALEKETPESWNEFLDEQKLDNKIEPKFKVGDWVVYHRDDSSTEIMSIYDIRDNRYYFNDNVHFSWSVKECDEKCHLWTIQDAKDSNVLCYKDEISLYKHDIKKCTKQGTTFGGFVYHCCYDGKRFIMDSLYSLTEQDKMDIHPATKEQRNLLFQKIKEAGYNWDTEKKELKKIEQNSIEGTFINVDEVRENFVKEIYRVLANDTTNDRANDIIYYFDSLPTIYLHTNKPLSSDGDDFDMNYILKNRAWSEEDENMLKSIIATCELAEQDRDSSPARHLFETQTNWLKSLKNRVGCEVNYTTKEGWSEEDDAMFNFIALILRNHQSDEDFTTFKTTFKDCIDWLKSLRPQKWTKEDKERYISCLQRLNTGNPEQPETINSKWFKEHVYPYNTWKPSEEQMNALNAINVTGVISYAEQGQELITLFNDLKRLKG